MSSRQRAGPRGVRGSTRAVAANAIYVRWSTLRADADGILMLQPEQCRFLNLQILVDIARGLQSADIER
jgi:hypothetical protein